VRNPFFSSGLMDEAPKKHFNGLIYANEEGESTKIGECAEDYAISKLLSGFKKFDRRKLPKPKSYFQD